MVDADVKKSVTSRGEADAHNGWPFVQVALIAGCIYTGVGILNLGWVTQFLSHSVIGGFMSGASLIIGLSQARHIAVSLPHVPHDRPMLDGAACHQCDWFHNTSMVSYREQQCIDYSAVLSQA